MFYNLRSLELQFPVKVLTTLRPFEFCNLKQLCILLRFDVPGQHNVVLTYKVEEK